MRQMLPAVAVPELPADPALYVRTLMAAGYFELTKLSAEDLARAEFYQGNNRRLALQEQAGDLDAYLASLEMEITFQPFDDLGRHRIAQLINKSNQFNLTTRRYTEVEIAQMQREKSVYTLQVRLRDVFGDNGMISVVICRALDRYTLEIDSWLMSCRVLGRRVEEAVLQQIAGLAKKGDFTRIQGQFIPTEKNALVRDHYCKLGFKQKQQLPNGTTTWVLQVNEITPFTPPMLIFNVESELHTLAQS